MFLLVANPSAQSGKNAARISRAVGAFAQRGLVVDVMRTEPEGRTPGIVAAAIDAKTPDVVIAMGGDGTFAEVAKGVLQASHPTQMGFLPTGTANNQGKSLGVPAQEDRLEDAVDLVCRRDVIRLDVGEIQVLHEGRIAREDVFFDNAGIGLQARVLVERNADREIVAKVPVLRDVYRDYLVYAGALLDLYVKSFVEPMKFDAVLRIDGRAVRVARALDVIVKNTAVYAGAWVFDETARPDDGKLEIVTIASRRDWLAHALVDLEGHPLPRENAEHLGLAPSKVERGAVIELVVDDKDLAVQLDGDPWGEGRHFRVRVLPNLLPVITGRR